MTVTWWVFWQTYKKYCYTSELQGLKSETVKAYLTHVNFYEMSKGVFDSVANSQLGKQLIQGLSNAQRDPRAAANEKTRRPITPAMIRLLGHSIASSKELCPYEKSLRWTVVLVAFWGSFRQEWCKILLIFTIRISIHMVSIKQAWKDYLLISNLDNIMVCNNIKSLHIKSGLFSQRPNSSCSKLFKIWSYGSLCENS